MKKSIVFQLIVIIAAVSIFSVTRISAFEIIIFTSAGAKYHCMWTRYYKR